METFISTIVFLLPGFLMYLWIHSFGINPVQKHSPAEMAAISALMWLPVSLITLVVYNGLVFLFGASVVWSLEILRIQSSQLGFLTMFSLLSVPVSFFISWLYAKFLFPFQMRCINSVRSSLKLAPLSESPTVWDEFFVKINKERKEGSIPVKIYKFDKQNEAIMGLIGSASRPFEAERAIVLVRSNELKRSHDDYQYESDRVYIDLKSGMVIEELNLSKPTNDD